MSSSKRKIAEPRDTVKEKEEFVAEVVETMIKLWDNAKIVHGRPRHPESQGSVERANGDIERMLFAWLKEHDTKDWVAALPFVQFHVQNWRQLPVISIRQGATFESPLGGQGFFKCSCHGACDSNRCACKKADVLCGSRCHKGANGECKNCEAAMVFKKPKSK